MNRPEERLALALVVIGGLNWGLVGLGYFFDTNLNVVNLIFGNWPAVENIVYILVGLSALWLAYSKMAKKG